MKSERDGLQAGPSLDTAPSKPVRHVMLDSGSRPEWPVQARAGQARPGQTQDTNSDVHRARLSPKIDAHPSIVSSGFIRQTRRSPIASAVRVPPTIRDSAITGPQTLGRFPKWNGISACLSATHRRYVAPVPPRQSPAERDGPPSLCIGCNILLSTAWPHHAMLLLRKGGVLLRVRGSLCSGPAPHTPFASSSPAKPGVFPG